QNNPSSWPKFANRATGSDIATATYNKVDSAIHHLTAPMPCARIACIDRAASLIAKPAFWPSTADCSASSTATRCQHDNPADQAGDRSPPVRACPAGSDAAPRQVHGVPVA